MSMRSDVLFSHLFSDLSDQIPEPSLMRIKEGDRFWPGMTFKDRAAASIVDSLMKKHEGVLNNITKAKALEKFISINDRCGTWGQVADEHHYGDDFLIAELKNFIYQFWHRSEVLEGCKTPAPIPLVDHPYDILSRGGVGPGSAIGSIGKDFYTKFFSSRMATTRRGLYDTYKRYIRSFPEWHNAELTRAYTYGEPDIVKGNRLDFVAKNDDISRSICVEPSLNMFYQKGFGSILESRMANLWGLNLTYQQFKNRELARKGSFDGSFSTIDLSSASDSISLAMLKRVLPVDFFNWLMLLRSPASKLPDGKLLTLNMVSTMGNGYTFPLQTMLFACVVLSAFKVDGLEPIFPWGDREGNFGVNGDDIVVPSRITSKVLRLLQLLGFTPNGDKTFVEGPFRESCGGDYFLGRNLRGVYIKTLNTHEDYYSVINQLNLFSTRTGLLLPRLVQLLLKKVKFLPVPIWEDDSSGVKVPLSVARRYVGLCPDTQSILYRARVSTPPPLLRIKDSTIHTPRGYKPRSYNSSGLFTSILQGSLSTVRGKSGIEEVIPLKPERANYRTKSRIAPNWDVPMKSDIRTIQLFAGWFDYGRWETSAYLNLFK